MEVGEQIAELQRRFAGLERENAALRQENAGLRKELEEWKRGHRERGKRRSSRAEGKRRATGRPRGRKPEHKGAFRPEPKVDDTVDHPTWFGLAITPGGITQMSDRVRRWSEAGYSEIADDVHAAAMVGIDETGLRQDGVGGWVWLVRTAKASLFRVELSRGSWVASRPEPPDTPLSSCQATIVTP